MEHYNFDQQNYDYNDFKEPYGGSVVLAYLRCFLGAVIGAIPGMLIWIILGKLGVVAAICGALIALGIVIGCDKLTPEDAVPAAAMIVIGVIVFVGAISISEVIAWTWKISEVLLEYLPELKNNAISELAAEYPEYNADQIREVLTDDLMEEWIYETYGIREGTFGECFSNFGSLLKHVGLRGKFFLSLGESLLFGLGGGIYALAKMGYGNK